MSRGGVDATGPRRRAWAPAAALCVLCAALALTACGSSGRGLIPSAHAGPLLGDFETVQQAAEAGGGDCSATEAALAKTEEDFHALPSSIDHGLRANLRQGIANLRVRAHELCSQPAGGTRTTDTTKTATTPTEPKTTTTPTTPTTPKTTTTPPATTTTPPSSGGGTPAPGEGPGASGGSQGNEERPAGGEESASGGAGAPEGSK